MSEFDQVRDGVRFEQVPDAVESHQVREGAPAERTETPVAVAMRELESLAGRDLGEHPDVYQRIHAELQSALATIDNA